MATIPTASDTLDREFLEIRAKILQVGAALDRLDRSTGEVDNDPRLEKLRRAIQILLDEQDSRAEQIQLVFSRPYETNWRTRMGVDAGKQTRS